MYTSIKKVWLLAILCVAVSFAQNLKGQNYLVEGETEYNFLVKLSPQLRTLRVNNAIHSHALTRSTNVDSLLTILNSRTFVPVFNFTAEEQQNIRTGRATRNKNGFDKGSFSGLLSMNGAKDYTGEELLEFARILEQFDEVEYCQVSPIEVLIPRNIPNRTSYQSTPQARSKPSCEHLQFYLDGQSSKDPNVYGVDARYAWSIGITGEGVSVGDMEWAYLDHEDFVGQNVIYALRPDEAGQERAVALGQDIHGTAVIGMLYAVDNDFGITGMVHGLDTFHFFSEMSQFGTIGQAGGRIIAIAEAIETLDSGDVLMYQMQEEANNGKGPADWLQTVWDITKQATESGIIVVAAAGNLHTNFDTDPACVEYNARGSNGTIYVSAGTRIGRKRCGDSSFGSRFRLCAVGEEVVTTGSGYTGGHTFGTETDPMKQYTGIFAATSAAAPMVVAAAVALCSLMQKAN